MVKARPCRFGGAEGGPQVSNKPPKESKKKPLLTPKEKKAVKKNKKHAGDTVFEKP